MERPQRIADIGKGLLWEFAYVAFVWVALFVVAALLLLIFQDQLRGIFF